MKKITTLLLLLFISVLMVECSTAKKTASTQPPVDNPAVAEIKRNFTPAQMEEGKLVWQAKCQKCHKLYSPESHSVAKWEDILVRMNAKAKLTEDEAGKVRAYVLTNAKS